MMENKLCLALLLVGTFCCGQTLVMKPNGTEAAQVDPASVNGSDQNLTSHVQNNSNTNPVSSYTNATTQTTTSAPLKPTNDNGADVSPVTQLLDKNENATEQNVTSTSHTSPPTTRVTFTSPAYTPSSTPPSSNHTNTSDHSASPPPSSTAPSNLSNHTAPGTHPPTDTSQTSRHAETSSKPPPQSTSTPVNSTSTQARIHSESPSQLSEGGDTAVHHDSPALDPLLAGLVSAFIITAVIIMLLIFLKLRRRDSGPEFRRLQELPMDDMEDTPLYSY